jgi:ribosomal protein S18 acetylase RimI-like enzyme
MREFDIRHAVAGDLAFLEDMLVEAANAPARVRGRAETLADPGIGHYIDGWPRATDLGLVATEAGGRRIGAVWLRYFTSADPGHGFVRADIPELAIGVVADQRGRGIGRALLRAIAAMARDHGTDQISLSVEKDNPARLLYRSEGYRTTTSREHALTMVLDLERGQPHRAGNPDHRDAHPGCRRVDCSADHVRPAGETGRGPGVVEEPPEPHPDHGP